MTFIDILILIVFVAAVAYGFHRGIISQMGALAAMFVGVLACRLFGDACGSVVLAVMTHGNEEVSATAAYSASVLGNVIVLLIAYIAVRALVRGLRLLSRLMLMGPLDKLLGAVFTLAEWMLGLSVILNLWMALFPDSTLTSDSTLSDGLAVGAVMDFAPWLLGIISPMNLF